MKDLEELKKNGVSERFLCALLRDVYVLDVINQTFCV